MAPSQTYPTWDHRQPDAFIQPWVTIAEAGRPVIAPREYEAYQEGRMIPESEYRPSRMDGPVRMFEGPIGPSPEEDKDAPFFVGTSPTCYQHDFRDRPGTSLPRHHPQYRDDSWRFDVPLNGSHQSYSDREYPQDEHNLYSAQRHVPRDHKSSNFPYSKQIRNREHSRERPGLPSLPKSRRHNAHVSMGRHRHRASSIARRQSSRETSVSSTSQSHRQLSHDDTVQPRSPFRPELSPQSTYCHERSFSSPESLPRSPISTPSVAGRNWNGTPPDARPEEPYASRAIAVLNQMLQTKSLDQILYHWKSTGQGPNPYEYPQWKGWFKDLPTPRPLSPHSMRSDAACVVPRNS
jgi:hypothetical protein